METYSQTTFKLEYSPKELHNLVVRLEMVRLLVRYLLPLNSRRVNWHWTCPSLKPAASNLFFFPVFWNIMGIVKWFRKLSVYWIQSFCSEFFTLSHWLSDSQSYWFLNVKNSERKVISHQPNRNTNFKLPFLLAIIKEIPSQVEDCFDPRMVIVIFIPSFDKKDGC